MKRLFWLVLAGFLGPTTASLEASMSYYALELRGGSRIYSLDPPVRKGKVLLFHGYPDGTYMSLSAAEVERVSKLEAEPSPQAKLAPGATVYVGGALEGPSYEVPPSPPPPSYSVDAGYDYGYGYTGSYWGGSVPPTRPPPSHLPPSRIGPNGFPILAPPGSPGSAPPPVGSNGFPILSAPPPVAAPRQR
jgi:hypothetical protein